MPRRARRPPRPKSRQTRARGRKPEPITRSRSQVDQPWAIVAIGASAGGLEAITQVLERVESATRLAFIFVQHLSPQHSSALPELLRGKTSLQVVSVRSGTAIAPGHLYVIPPNVQMDVVNGQLHLLPRPADRSQYTPVDVFMQSLARSAGNRAIGVILSGTGSDGAAGIREIKALGGITIAQRPDTARHDGMPRAAVATGMVDLVLAPHEIAERLMQVPAHPYLSAPPDANEGMAVSDAQLREVLVILRRASGIDFKQYKTPTIRRRLLRRMAVLRLTDISAYLQHLLNDPTEARQLSQDLLIHVTRFFRDPESFDALRTTILSELLRDRSDAAIRIWVPGCATGEEAYSVGICLLEALGDRATERRIQIFATDVSDAAIEQARQGSYPPGVAADLSPERLKRFFVKTDAGYRVVKVLRDMCVFARHDLTRDPPFSRLDLIVCRNVLIYLDTVLQRRLIAVFHYALRGGGHLMLGPAESPGLQTFFTVVDKKWRLFRKSAADTGLPALLPSDLPATEAVSPVAFTRRPRVEGKSVQDEATRLILERCSPPAVVVDANYQIVQYRGHTALYLEPPTGEPSQHLLKLARGGLLHPLRLALESARKRQRAVRKDHLLVQRNRGWAEVTLEVVPMHTVQGEHFLVLFREPVADRPASGRSSKSAPARASRGTRDRLADLQRELTASREYLQSIIQELEAANEELQSANEEILSSNEELQSTNEELDTAKEELQSTNEELNTVNEELHSRNEELTRVNSDLTNLLGSVDIPIVIVGNDLGVRRFTPRAEQLFNLIPGDVGRPLGQLNPNFTSDGLESLIRETIDTISPREREVQDRRGRWLLLRIRPYKGVDNRLDGAVLSLIDINALKRQQASPAASQETADGPDAA